MLHGTRALGLLLAFSLLAAGVFLPARGVVAEDSTNGSTIGAPVGIAVFVDGERLGFDVPPQLSNGRVLVPIRALAQRLGAEVNWAASDQAVIISAKGLSLRFEVGSTQAWKNGQPVGLDQPALIVGGRTLVPLRFAGETLGASVQWVGEARSVLVDTGQWPDFSVLGYYVQYNAFDHEAYDTLVQQGDKIDYLVAFQYALEADGSVNTTYDPAEMLQYAKRYGKQALALFHNLGPAGNFDQAVAHSLLSDPAARHRAVENIYTILSTKGYRGVNVDLENLDPKDRDSYTGWLQELQARLHPAGYVVTVSVPAKTYDDPEAPWSGAFDYAAIGQVTDQVLIMAYDEHYQFGVPGPVASLGWVQQVMAYASRMMPPRKLVLGIAAYGYDWPTDGSAAKAVTSRQALRDLALRNATPAWDYDAEVPVDQTGEYVRYFEDADSTAFKLQQVFEHHWAGVAIWRLGFEDPRLWPRLAAGQG